MHCKAGASRTESVRPLSIRPLSVFLVKFWRLIFQLVMWLLWLWKQVYLYTDERVYCMKVQTVLMWLYSCNSTNCKQMWLYSCIQVLSCLFYFWKKRKQLIPKTWSGITAPNRWQHMERAHSWPSARKQVYLYTDEHLYCMQVQTVKMNRYDCKAVTVQTVQMWL